MDSLKCQTSTATPAEPGDLPWPLELYNRLRTNAFLHLKPTHSMLPAGPPVTLYTSPRRRLSYYPRALKVAI